MSIAAHIKAVESSIPANARVGAKLAVAAVHAAVAPMMSIHAFKSLLLAEHVAGRLTLSRCDIPRGFAPGALAASEIAHPSGIGSFHLVSVA